MSDNPAMSGTTVTTNHQWHDFLYRSEVPASVLADRFDHLDEDEHDGFFKYRGWWYHHSDFTRCPSVTQQPADPLNGWDGYHADSYFSGVLIKLSDDGEQYKIGTWIS